MMIAPSAVTAIILAGGLGRRMSADGRGVDKALTPYRGRPLIAHVIERIGPQVGTVLINSSSLAPALLAFGLQRIADELPDRPGPLAGLHAGMGAASTEWVVCVPCDAPRLPSDLVARLGAALADTAGATLAVAEAAGRLQPVCLLARRDLRETISDYIAEGGRAVEPWLARQRHVRVHFDDDHAFVNLNSQDDLRACERD